MEGKTKEEIDKIFKDYEANKSKVIDMLSALKKYIKLIIYSFFLEKNRFFMLSSKEKFLIKKISAKGYYRIPVFEAGPESVKILGISL